MNISRLYLTLVALFVAGGAFAQTSENPNKIRVSTGIHDSYGPHERETFPFGLGNDENLDGIFQLQYLRHIDSFWDLGGGVTAARTENLYDDDFNNFQNLLSNGSSVDVDFIVKYKFANGVDFKENALIKPYIHSGLSGTYISNLDSVRPSLNNNFSTNIPFGIGLDGGKGNVSLDIKTGMRFGMWDKIPNRWEHTVGLGFGFGPPKQAEEPEVEIPMPEPVVEEPEPEPMPEPEPEPEVIIVADTDGDGVPDKDDDCPETAGTLSGCPDSDGDGIADKDDNCPETAGVAAEGGCPEVKDRDGDGIEDAADACPDTPGVAANKGCPEVKEEVVARLEAIAKDVRFETNSSTLTSDSKRILDEVVSIVAANPGYRLSIEGHTDSVGDAGYNQKLSERRAASVRDYLASKGLGSVSSAGYGEAQPIADNGTSAGRAQNRRVVLRLDPK